VVSEVVVSFELIFLDKFLDAESFIESPSLSIGIIAIKLLFACVGLRKPTYNKNFIKRYVLKKK